MDGALPPTWLRWMRRLQAVASTGLEYASDPYDVARYEEVRSLAAEIAAQRAGPLADGLAPLLTRDVGHPTPKVEVRGALFSDDRILLVRERADGRWSMPGGWADVGEPPSVAVEREVQEEAGWRVHAQKLVAVHDRDRHNRPPHVHSIWKIFFLCNAIETEPGPPDHEIEETRFFARDELPILSTGRTSADQVELAFEHHTRPDLPTAFD